MEVQIDQEVREQARLLYLEARSHVKSFRTSKTRVDIDCGVELSGKAAQMLPRGSDKWLDYTLLHAYYLELRYRDFHDIDDLMTAIRSGEEWLSEASQTREERPMGYLDVGDRWLLLFSRTKDRVSIEKALSCADAAYAIVSVNMTWHQRTLRLLGRCYDILHTSFPDADSYEKLLQALEKSYEVANRDQDEGLWTDVLSLILTHVRYWFDTGDLNDAKRATPVARHYVKNVPEGQPYKSIVFRFIGEILEALYKAGMEPVSALDEAFGILMEGLDICTDTEDKAEITNSLTIICIEKFDIAEVDKRLVEEAIHHAQQSLQLTPSHAPAFQIRRQNLAICFRKHHDITGSVQSLNEAIKLCRQTLATQNLLPEHQMAASNSLSKYLDRRYDSNGSIDDLDEAIFYAKEALACLSETDKAYHAQLQNLNVVLSRRATRTRKLEDREDCIRMTRDLLNTAATAKEKDTFRYNLSLDLHEMYKITGDLDVWAECLSLARQVHDAVSTDHPVELAQRSFHLGCVVYDEYVRNKCQASVGALNESIKLLRQSVESIPRDHRLWAGFAWTLSARCFERTVYYTKESPEYSKSIRETIHISTLAFDSLASPMYRLAAGRVLVHALRLVNDWKGLHVVGKEVLALSVKINPRSLSHRDMQELLRRFSTISSLIAINALKVGDPPGSAFLMLETGRGLISDMVLSKRSDVALLEVIDADLSSRYQSLLGALSAPRSAGFDGDDFLKYRQVTLQKVLEVEDEIRKTPGLERFRLPPSIEQLQQLAEAGPLVTFAADSLGSVAFVITTEKIDAVPLPKLSYSTIEFLIQNVIGRNRITKCSIAQRNVNNTALKIHLEWLWDAAVKPVMDHLGFQGSKDHKDLPRVWWITNGLIGLLPIHAAGSDWDRSFENTASRCVSSYVSTTKALARARQQARRLTSGVLPTRCVAVEVPHTPEKGWPDLKTEVEMEQIRLQGKAHDVSVEVHTGPTVQQLLDALSSPHSPTTEVDKPADTASTPDRGKTKTLLHLACHGDPHDLDPSETALLLCNPDRTAAERLTIAQLFELDQANAYLAYLSACCTAQQYNTDLIDESMHLAALFQLLGFPHVIGTLWEADDASATSLAGFFYRRLFRVLERTKTPEDAGLEEGSGNAEDDERRQEDAVARCLHESLIELRAKKLARGRVMRDDVIAWAGFICLGA